MDALTALPAVLLLWGAVAALLVWYAAARAGRSTRRPRRWFAALSIAFLAAALVWGFLLRA